MAARLNPFNQESVKQKIQASQLVNRLQKHAFGEIEMTPTQIDSAKFLLNKRLSNAPTEVQSVEALTAGSLTINITEASKPE